MTEFLKPINIGPLSFQYVRVFFTKANVQVAVEHQLGVIPMGWPVVRIDKHARIKDGAMPPASNVVYLISDTDAVTATIRVEALNLSER